MLIVLPTGQPVLPGLRSRPLLSGVARGVGLRQVRLDVLPGLRSRPLLSGPHRGREGAARRVLPGLRSRPLLSEDDVGHAGQGTARVAGASVPAFVER